MTTHASRRFLPRSPALIGWWGGGLALVLLAAVVMSATIGAVAIRPGNVGGILLDELVPGVAAVDWTRAERHIVWELRAPRAVLAAAVGAALATIGAVLQVLTRNPLADPYLFGISSGAAAGAVTVILYAGKSPGAMALPVAAFAGALLAMAIVFAASRTREGTSSERLILTGVSVAFILQALTNFLIFNTLDRGADTAIFWMLGGFSNARWHMVPLPAVVTLAGIAWLSLRARAVDALVLGDDAARSVGVDPFAMRLEVFVVTAVMTGATVCASGAIGFVGLILPHAVRRLTGGELRRLLPITALGGAVFLVCIDILARVALAPREVPLGVMTALVGGVFFLALTRGRT
jgi:iron complex transport system permease protein